MTTQNNAETVRFDDGRQTESNESRYNWALAFMVAWEAGARVVTPRQAERYYRRVDALANRMDENPRRMRRTIRDHARRLIAAAQEAAA